MKNVVNLSCLLFVLAPGTISAQNEGTIRYQLKTDWVKMSSRLPWLSDEEKARNEQTYKNYNLYTTDFLLAFDGAQSIYHLDDDEEGSWSSGEDYWINHDLANQKTKEWYAFKGRQILVDDTLSKPKWKILNDIKEVAGHICMKAELTDTLRDRKVVAWFASDIPTPIGPDRYFGLPGAILEIDKEGVVTITASKIELKKPDAELMKLPKRMKGRKTTQAEINTQTKEHIETSMKNKRNPYGRGGVDF